ncbi:MAG: photosystem II protein PsbQ [Leptolyngbya sp. SIO1D8]|nr:photosystem II protein PsbQ [Leptolyngbya sp. SIO1D8]
MARYRSVLGFVLAAITVFVVGCGGANISQPNTYTPDKLAEIQIYSPRVTELRNRFPELEDYIQKKDWVNIRSFIHGPMGELRARLGRVAVRLLPQDAEQAKVLADNLATHLERLDSAAESYDQIQSGKEYRLALDDFDAFLSLVPETSNS